MLDVISARELAEWMAYERFAGPIDDQWTAEIQAQSNERLQMVAYLEGAGFKKNPIKKPERVPRPWEMFGAHEAPQDLEDEVSEADQQAADIAAFDREAFGSKSK